VRSIRDGRTTRESPVMGLSATSASIELKRLKGRLVGGRDGTYSDLGLSDRSMKLTREVSRLFVASLLVVSLDRQYKQA